MSPNVLEVDLDAIAHNVRRLRQSIGGGVQLFAALKANAYGFGIERVADTIVAAGAQHAKRCLRVFLKVDVGLERLGASPENMPSIAADLRALRKIELDGVYTHLARVPRDANGGLNEVPLAIQELGYFSRAGGATVVEVTHRGLGRDPCALAEIARATGLNLVMGARLSRLTSYRQLASPRSAGGRSH